MKSHLMLSALLCALGVLAAATGCARLGLHAAQGPLRLETALDSAALAPGQAALCAVTLTNTSGASMNLPALDGASLRFGLLPRPQKEQNDLQFIEPVISSREQTGGEIALAPGASASRTFVLPSAALRRGEMALNVIYDPVHPGAARELQRVYAPVVSFEVAGKDVAAHRYVNGLLTREDAIAIACGRPLASSDNAETTGSATATASVAPATAAPGSGAPAAAGPQAILVRDEAGFLKWWVNGPAEGGAPVKAWFVDPYLARVWASAKPFKPEDRAAQPAFPEGSKLLQELRQSRLNN